MNTILEVECGSASRSNLLSEDRDFRRFVINPKFDGNFHFKSQGNEYDVWEVRRAIKSMLYGGEDTPFLFNSFICKVSDVNEYGQRLLDMHRDFINVNMIWGVNQFINKKVSMAKQGISPEKQLYYAVTETLEFIDNVNGELTYPTEVSEDAINIKYGIMSFEDSLDVVHEARKKLNKLKITNEPDEKVVTSYINSMYEI